PDDVAAQDTREVVGLLLLAAARDERGAGVLQSDESSGDVGGADPRILLVPDELLHEGRTAPPVLLRPIDARPPGVVHAPLPGHVVGSPRRQVGALGTRTTRPRCLEPRPPIRPAC